LFSAAKNNLGALGFILFWMLAASGIYLYIRFDTSAAGAYRSIGELEWWLGGILRSVHRYAADAFVAVVLLHLVRELAAGRFRRWRTFSWISGVPLLWLMYASGIVGYWLVWDARAQFSFFSTLEWFGMGANGLSAPADRLFSFFVFLHIGLPLALLAGMWIHVQRLGQPRTVPPRAMGWGLPVCLFTLALLLPVSSEKPWNAVKTASALDIDWFVLFAHPLMYATSPSALWAIVLGATAILLFLPRLFAGRPISPAAVDLDNCNGCGRCVADCPYEAVVLGATNQALVFPARCAACGICAGACPSATPFRKASELVSGIDMPDETVRDLRKKVQEFLDKGNACVKFQCAHASATRDGIALRCAAALPPSFIEYALRRGAREVLLIPCRDGECAWRIGDELAAARFTGAREPRLRATVRATRDAGEYRFALR